MKYKVGSLFAGVGGVCQAFKDSNCDVVWANEIDEKACITYKLNHKNTTLLEGDIKNLSKENLEGIDILPLVSLVNLFHKQVMEKVLKMKEDNYFLR